MKKLGTYTLALLGILLILFVVLEWVYTYAYNLDAARNKVMWVRNLDVNRSLDYVILGSSRAKNFIKPKQIEEQTGLLGLNLGMNAANAVEHYVMLQELLKKQQPDKVFVQVDTQFKVVTPDPIGEAPWMPYIDEDHVYYTFQKYGGDYRAHRSIPFYRYMIYESELGFRNVLPTLMGSGFNFDKELGYSARHNTLTEELEYIPDVDPEEENEVYVKLIGLCKANGIDLYFFTAPAYKFRGDLSKFNTLLPHYIDFSDRIPERRYFSDQTHVNDLGANLFTEIFIESYFSNTK